MLYAFLCCHDEAVVNSWSKEEDVAVLALGRVGSVAMRPSVYSRFAAAKPPHPRKLRTVISFMLAEVPRLTR